MQRKMFCALLVLAVSVGALAAADGKKSLLLDKSYPAIVLKVDDVKHTLFVKFQGPEGKFVEKSLSFPARIELANFKPGVKYTFFEQAGKVIAVQPFATPPIANKTPKDTPVVTGPKQTIKPAQPPAKATPPLATAVAESKKAEQAKLAAVATMKTKAAAYQAATAKFEQAKTTVDAAEKGHAAAIQIVKTQESAAKMAEFKVFCANLEAKRVAAYANVANAKLALAQAEAAKAKAMAQVSTAQVALAKVEFANLTEAKALAVRFEKAKAVAATTAHNFYQQAQSAMAKTFQEKRTAEQFVQQMTTVLEKAQARVKQFRADAQKITNARVAK